MVNEDAVNSNGNLSNTNKKPGGPGLTANELKASKTTVKKISLDQAKNDAKNTMTSNSGNKQSGGVTSA